MPDGRFVRQDICMQDGVFTEASDGEIIDASDCYAIPGLIDIHFHGCLGKDFCDGTPEAIRVLASYEASRGITAICPATLTLSEEELCRVLREAACFKREREVQGGERYLEADLVGINMEGPFISREKKGAQNEAFIRPCSAAVAEKFLASSGGLVKIIGLAPEASPHFEEYIRCMKDRVRISLAHTNADYSQAMAAIAAGASHVVHLYNAMSGLSHREPGVVGAAADSRNVYCELITDGIHVHEAAVRAAFRMMGEDRIVLISDSLRSTGLGDGRIDLGGQAVIVKGRRAVLEDGGAIAGSVTDLMECLRIAVLQMGIPLETAVKCATLNPAKAIGIEKDYGSIEKGKKAHLVLLRKEDLNVSIVIKDGCVIRQNTI